MTVTGAARKFDKRYKFIVQIDRFQRSAFQACSELSAEAAIAEQWEGGAMLAEKEPARVTIPEVTLSRGATAVYDMWWWFREVSNLVQNGGTAPPTHERTVDIVQQNRSGATLKRWRLFRCWPSKFVAGEWDNTSDENVIESLTLVVHSFRIIRGSPGVQ
jgi:phage tail-like protein